MTTTMSPGTTTVTPVAGVPPIDHREAMVLAAEEYDRTLEVLAQLTPGDWRRPTVCSLWDVRAMAGHMLGMAEAQARMRQFAHDAYMASKRDGGAMIDAMTATQVGERSHLTTTQLIERFAAVAPRAVRARSRVPALMRSAVRLKQDPPFDTDGRWTYGFLNDIIFTRDPWIHRLDISRAIGRDMKVTAQHDGRLVADIVAEWARRHGRPFTLHLTGDAGGSWRAGDGGEVTELEALDFCWLLAGRAPASGLLSTRVPF